MFVQRVLLRRLSLSHRYAVWVNTGVTVSSAHIMMFALTVRKKKYRAGRCRVPRLTNLQSEMRLINVNLLSSMTVKLTIFQFRIVGRTREPFEKCFIDQTIILKTAVTLENTHFSGLTQSAEGMILVSRMLKRFC